MHDNPDHQIQQSEGPPINRRHGLLGVMREEEYFARQEAERRRKLAEER